MDPELLRVLRELSQKRQRLAARGTTIAPEHIEEFVRARTEGRFGRLDAETALRDPATLSALGSAPAPTSDPAFLRAVRQMLTARERAAAAGESLLPEDLEAFLREETGGWHGLEDAQRHLASIDDGLTARNLGRSALAGLSFDWIDELGGLAFGPAFREDSRLRAAAFHAKHPVADNVTMLVGGIAPTLALPEVRGASMLATAGRGALAGGAAGALAGAGAGESGASRLGGAAVGGAAGAGLGALLPGLVAGVRSLYNPVLRGARRLAHAVDASGGVAAVAARNAAMAAAGRGDDAMLLDLTPRLRAEGDYAANASDDVWTPMAQRLAARQRNQSDRLLTDVRETIPVELTRGGANVGDLPHGPTRVAQLDAGTQSWAAGPNGYGGLRDIGATIPIDRIAAALSKPGVRDAWRHARLAGDLLESDPIDQLITRLAPHNPTATPDQLRAAAVEVGPTVAARTVTFSDMHQLKRLLDGKAGQAFAKGNGELGQAYATLRDAVKESIAAAVPNAARVDRGYAYRKSLSQAVADGMAAWRTLDTRQLQQTVTTLAQRDPNLLREYRRGIASELVESLRSKGANRDASREIVEASQNLQAKLRVLYGDEDTFQSFVHRVEAERELSASRSVVGGSATARRIAASGFDPAEVAGDLGIDASLLHNVVPSATRVVAKAARDALRRNTARAMGPALMTSGTPEIDAFLRTLGMRAAPLGSGWVNRLSTNVAPAAAGHAASLRNP